MPKKSDRIHFYSIPERNLLLKSELTKKYSVFLEMIQKYESMNERIFKTLKEKEKEFLIGEIFVDIYNGAKNEWIALREGSDLKVIDIDSNRIPCGLCYQPNKLMFYIVNKINNEKINVGSSCIGKYGINCELGPNESIDVFIDKQRKRAERIMNLKDFYRKYPNAKIMVDSWKIDYENYSLMIPLDLEIRFNEIYQKATKIINKYENGKGSRNSFIKFKNTIKNKNSLFIEIEKYIENNKGNLFVADKYIQNWFKSRLDKKTTMYSEQMQYQNMENTYNLVKKAGCITENTFDIILEENYIRKFIPILNEKLKSNTNIIITDVNIENKKAMFTIKKDVTLHMDINISTLFRICKPLIFKNDINYDFIVNEVIKNSKITDIKSIDSFVGYINGLLKTRSICIEEYFEEFKEIYVSFENKNKYCVYNLNIFINDIKNKLFLKNKFDIKKDFETRYNKTVNKNPLNKLDSVIKARHKKIDSVYASKSFS